MPELEYRISGVKPDRERAWKYHGRGCQLAYLEYNLEKQLPGVLVEWDINQVTVSLKTAHSEIEIVGFHESWTAPDFIEFEAKTVRTLMEYL